MPERSPSLHRFAVLTATATFGLLFVGGLVTSTGSGLAVPDWPLSFGQVFPPMVGGVLFEHGHRLAASLVGVLTVVLALWTVVREPRPGVRALGLAALFAVVLQGVLGGVTVLYKLPIAVSVTHACLAQLFFCLTVTLAQVTAPGWTVRDAPRVRPGLALLAAATTALVFAQVFLGALVRHMHAGLAIPDFPLAFGRLVPPLVTPYITVHFAHRVGALVVAIAVSTTAVRTLRAPATDRWVRGPALLAAGLLLVQVTLGAFTIWSGRAVLPTTAHLVTGAALLATCLVLSLRTGVRAGLRAHLASRAKAAENYLELTKPRVVTMVLVATAAGYYLGSSGTPSLVPLFHTLLGTALAAGGTLALNQVMERDLDARMERTRRRPLPEGRLTARAAFVFGTALLAAGLAHLGLVVHVLAAAVVAGIAVTYLLLYTPLKPVTSLCSIVGAVPGALPPVAGWAAARGALGPEPWVLFAIMFLWQIPHSLAIGRLYRDDYARAGIRVLPVVDHDGPSTGMHVLTNCLALVPVALLPTLVGIAGPVYFLVALALGLGFLWSAIGLARTGSAVDARRVMLASLVYLPVLLGVMALDKLGS